MSGHIAQQAGSAFFWKTVQYAGVKGIFFIRLLVLARLLSPDDFGLLAVSMVALEIMTVVTEVGMVPALVQRSTANDTHYHTAWTVGILRAFIITGVVFLAAPFVAHLFKETRATSIIQVVAIKPLLEASASIKVAELVRNLRFRSITVIRLPEAIANTCISIALAPSLGVWALVAGTLAGPVAVLVLSYVMAPYRPHFSIDRDAAYSLVKFGRWIFLIGVIAVAGSSGLRLVIGRELGTVELGLYTLAASLAFLPYEVARQVIGDVTFPLYARLQRNLSKVSRAFQAVFTGIIVVLFPISALLIVLAPALVEHVLGPKWEGAAPVMQILGCVNIISLPSETIMPILKGIGKPARVVIIESIQAILLIGLVLIFARNWGLPGAAFAWLPAVAVSQIISCLFVRHLLPQPFGGLLKPLFSTIVVSICGAFLAEKTYALWPGLLGLILGICLSVAFIGYTLWILDQRLSLGLIDGLARAFPKIAAYTGYKFADD